MASVVSKAAAPILSESSRPPAMRRTPLRAGQAATAWSA